MFRCLLVLCAVIIALGAMSSPAFAQTTQQIAYLNTSGQVVIASADGGFRWIVTNPGESLAPESYLAWSPSGDELLLAIQNGSQTSLRVATPNGQTVREITQVVSPVRGGEWTPNGRQIVIGTGSGIVAVDMTGRVTLLAADGQITSGQTLANNGAFAFYAQSGTFALASMDGSNATQLPGSNPSAAGGIGLWADSEPLVAYWSQTANQTTALNITNATTSNTLTLDSGSTVPITPLDWVPGTSTLLYRSVAGINAIDANSGESRTILPVTVSHIATTRNALIYTLNGALYGIGIDCIAAGNCSDGASNLDQIVHGGQLALGQTLTAYTGTDNMIHALDLTCVTSGSCTPITLGTSGTVHSVAQDNRHILATVNGELRVLATDGSGDIPLTGSTGVVRAAWN